MEEICHNGPLKTRAPGYTVTKAYRPIALLNVISKILSACVANRLNTIVETHTYSRHITLGAAPAAQPPLDAPPPQICQGCVEKEESGCGAFPHLGIPLAIVNWTARKLEGRGTTMKFDDFESKPFEIQHGIDQGCPLLCIFYLIYNSDLIKRALISHRQCKAEKDDGKERWRSRMGSNTHLGFCSGKNRACSIQPLPPGGSPVIFDAKLTWGEQRLAVLRKATKWAHMVKRSAQRIVALAITGALRTAPTDTVLAHADSPLDNPETASQHRSQPGQLRDQPLIQHPTPALKLLNPYVAPGGTDEAIADKSTLKPTVKIFSDGSMVGGNVGAAAVLIREGKEEVVARKYIGSDREHEVYKAEVVGLILGLELLARERGVGEAIFFIDNQAEANPGVKLEARWIPGHKGVDGNERADVAAKLAATPGNDTNILLPGPLKKAIPVNPTAAKQERKARMEGEWADWIEDKGNPRQTQALQLIDNTYPSMNFKKAADLLTRMEYATLTQLRTGHYPTSTYLFRTTLADSPRCPHCESQNENVFHLLIGCKATEGYRREQDQAMGAASRSVNLLLKPGEHTKHLMGYLRKVRACPGEQVPHGAERR
ncbi:Reverse transcriptase (RNA-dependent DNA polymerase) [Rhizoctonia solani]|uniref:Reverse transcriptase (RNA-dependent DNA polymerase) n=1 Tax=Rhizoctonia solani TaxID=456999 RepID=A0A8H7IFG2_9AGAM|nr:Reverse transcriptase (RNA-dependent DNA polymerase) [Rhizoctonia solani]